MLLFDTGKKLEKAVGEEAASIIMQVFEQYDEQTKKESATKGDLRETELRLQAEIEKVRAEIQKIKFDLLKWQIGIAFATIVIMAKGFGWLGF